MKSKIFKMIIVLSVTPYYAVVICGAIVRFTAVSVFSEYSLSAFIIDCMYMLYFFSNSVPLIPFCLAFHFNIIADIIVKKIIEKFNISADVIKILYVIIAVFSVFGCIFIKTWFFEFYENVDFAL